MSDNLRKLQNRQEEFIDERGWDQFHMPKSLAMAISVESNELVELFQWHDNLPAEAYAEDSKIRDDVKDELADIVIYSLSMASAFGSWIAVLSFENSNLSRSTSAFSIR